MKSSRESTLLTHKAMSSSCITSVVRVKYVTIFAPTADLTWDNVLAVAWSVVELLSGGICVNLPPCRHLIAKLFPRQMHSTTGGVMTYTTMSQAYGPDSFGASRLTHGGHVTSVGTVTTIISSGTGAKESDRGESRRWLLPKINFSASRPTHEGHDGSPETVTTIISSGKGTQESDGGNSRPWVLPRIQTSFIGKEDEWDKVAMSSQPHVAGADGTSSENRKRYPGSED